MTPDTKLKPDPTMVTVLPEGGLPAVREAKPVLDDNLKQGTSRPPVTVAPETVRNISLAITKVMAEVGIIEKTGHNRFHNYKFAQMQDILQKLSPLMAKHGLAVLQSELRRAEFDSGRVIAVEYGFTLIHTSGEIWPRELIQSGMSRCRDSKGGFDDKSLNKCHTSARKYYLLALFQIATGEEDDADLDADKVPTRPIRKPPMPPHDATPGELLDDEIPDFDNSPPDGTLAVDRAGAPAGPPKPPAGVSVDRGPPDFVDPPIRPPPASLRQAADHTPRVSPATGAGGAVEPDSERLMRLDEELTTAAEEGTEELRRAWLLIPPRDRPALEAALRNRHKIRAAAIDAAKAP